MKFFIKVVLCELPFIAIEACCKHVSDRLKGKVKRMKGKR